MAPIKFEEQVKEKLEKRALQPSPNAWNTLSKRLDSQEQKKTVSPFWWVGLAASVVGVLFVASQFFNNDIEEGSVPRIVVTPEVINNKTDNQITPEAAKMEEGVLTENTSISGEIHEKLKEDVIKEDIIIAEQKILPKDEKDIVKSVELVTDNLTFEEQKIQDVVAQVKELQKNKKAVTEAEIDMLLAEAQKEITLEQLINNNTKIVDANLLLQDVEADIEEQSFRNKVFKALKESLVTVKTAVAQRND